MVAMRSFVGTSCCRDATGQAVTLSGVRFKLSGHRGIGIVNPLLEKKPHRRSSLVSLYIERYIRQTSHETAIRRSRLR